MAHVTKDGKIVLSVFGKKRILSVKKMKEKERLFLADRLEQLKRKLKGVDYDYVTAAWLEKIDDDLRNRLVDWGLLEPREYVPTVRDLVREYADRPGLKEATRKHWEEVGNNLLEFFGETKPLQSITREDVYRFGKWLRETPLNRRGLHPLPYSEGTVNRRITAVKGAFRFAVQLGWIEHNFFETLKGGDSVNPDRFFYIPMEMFQQVLSVCDLYWQLVLMFGRYCGVRGSSELYQMEWEDIHWTGTDRSGRTLPGFVFIRASKTAKYNRQFRKVPLHPDLERALLAWIQQVPENTGMVFPGMQASTNFSVMAGKLMRKAGLVPPPNPWYNLRKSFCTDLFQKVRDSVVYEHISDHSVRIAKKHYQMMTDDRLEEGIEQARAMWAGGLESPGNFLVTFGVTERCTQALANSSDKLRQISEAPKKQAQSPIKKAFSNCLENAIVGGAGLEPVTPSLSS